MDKRSPKEIFENNTNPHLEDCWIKRPGNEKSFWSKAT
jgi:hypothetical protein